MPSYKDEIRARRSAATVASGIAEVLSSARLATEENDEQLNKVIARKPPPSLNGAPVPTSPKGQVEEAPEMLRRGVQFRPADLDLIADMVHACRKGRVHLSGKLGPSIILRAALEQLADSYENDRPRFLSIMAKYAKRRIGE